MSVKFPDILRHENENYAIVDINDIRGIYIVESLDAIQGIPEDKRRGGAIVSIIGISGICSGRTRRQTTGPTLKPPKIYDFSFPIHKLRSQNPSKNIPCGTSGGIC